MYNIYVQKIINMYFVLLSLFTSLIFVHFLNIFHLAPLFELNIQVGPYLG